MNKLVASYRAKEKLAFPKVQQECNEHHPRNHDDMLHAAFSSTYIWWETMLSSIEAPQSWWATQNRLSRATILSWCTQVWAVHPISKCRSQDVDIARMRCLKCKIKHHFYTRESRTVDQSKNLTSGKQHAQHFRTPTSYKTDKILCKFCHP